MDSRAIIKVGLLLAVAGFGAEVRVTDRIIPLVQDGGGYTTTITIVNLESTASSFEIFVLVEHRNLLGGAVIHRFRRRLRAWKAGRGA